jgi:hypothetical protein
MSAGGSLDNSAAPWQPGRWRCRIGFHDWRAVETADRDKYAECTRCGKRDWRRLLQNVTGEFRGSEPPPGAGDINVGGF